MIRIGLIVSVIFVFSSCLKEELPIPPHQQGDLVLGQVELGTTYGLQIYYDLATNSVVKINQKTDWDLAFECSTEGWHVILNSSLAMAAADMGELDFDQITETAGAEWNWDHQTGELDSTAIGDYRDGNHVYIVDRGYNEMGTQLGYKKIMLSYIDGVYEIKSANLDGTEEQIALIVKDASINFQAFSFNSHSAVDIEPPNSSWDLLFTQYTHIFQNPTMPYLVTGVLLNRYETTCAEDEVTSFDEISLENVSDFSFMNDLNVIGYDWKSYDGGSGQFTIVEDRNYILKDNLGVYHKLRFIDYYNDLGEKGAPKFEIQSL